MTDPDRPKGPLLISLADEAARNPRLVGNKAARLAQLLQRGHNVPTGIVITRRPEASESFMTELLESLERDGVRGPWAVRSSSTFEDSDTAAFAGVFRTVLGVRTAVELRQAIDQVFDSLSSTLVSTYVAARAVDARDANMAVLVQTLVNARSAGVAFTRHPVTGEDVVSVEATLGLGEPLVAGTITPDSWNVSQSGEIVQHQIGTKRKVLLQHASGTVEEVPLDPNRRTVPSLDTSDVLRVVALCRALEDQLGTPQDVEWALDHDGELVLLQARPITTRSRADRVA